MANVKIPDLPAASTPLAGTEQFEAVQSATSVKLTAQNIKDFSVPYLLYDVDLYQTGTSAPTATIYHNDLSGAIVWTRNSAGSYTGTLASAFPSNIGVSISLVSFVPNYQQRCIRVNANTISFEQQDNLGAGKDEVHVNLQLRVYP